MIHKNVLVKTEDKTDKILSISFPKNNQFNIYWSDNTLNVYEYKLIQTLKIKPTHQFLEEYNKNKK